MKTYSECKPTIIHRTELMSDDWVYMDKDLIKEKCRCKFKSTCLELIGSLERDDKNTINQLLNVLKNNQL